MTPQEQIEQKAETIKALWCRVTSLEKRTTKQQIIIDRQDQRIAELEAQKSPQAVAEAVFKEARK